MNTMGLLGNGWDDPQSQGLLSLAAGMISGNLGRGVSDMGAVMAGAKDRDMKRKYLDMQMQAQQMQLEQEQREQAQSGTNRRLLTDAFTPTSPLGALAGGGGPTPENAAKIGKMPPFNPLSILQGGGDLSAVKQALELQNALHPKPETKVLKPGDYLGQVGPDGTFTQTFAAPEKPEKDPEIIRQLRIIYGDGTPEFKSALRALGVKTTTHQPAASLTQINAGQKGFDNVLKLRSDFRSEPIYKAHQDVQSAHAQITSSLKQQSPAGDLAGATKLMKILDPGSVVRESELGMAMAASGLADRITNYAQMVMTGQKLTPTQRKDFQTLADALFAESQKQFSAKGAEYEAIASRNGLNAVDVVGPKASGANKGWSITPIPGK